MSDSYPDDADDLLGSFLNEISKVESEVAGSNEELNSINKETEVIPTKQTVVEMVVSKPQVIIRAPEIKDQTFDVIEKPYDTSDSQNWTNSYSVFESAGSNTGYYNNDSTLSYTNSMKPPAVTQQNSSTTSTSQQYTSNAATIPIKQSNKKFIRAGAGDVWEDPTLNEWPENDFRLFVGDLGNEVSSEMLAKEFQGSKSFVKAKVVRTKFNLKSRGYGFLSFMDPFEAAKVIREKNGKYLGNRPMKITKSDWKERNLNEVRKKDKKKRKLEESLGLI